MGGCASRPKESDCPPATLPGEHPATQAENPASQEPNVPNVEAEAPAAPENNNNEGEAQKEEPLVDLSEPTPKDSNTEGDKLEEPKDPVAQLPVAQLVPEVTKTLEEDNKTDVKKEDTIVASDETAEKMKDGPGGADLVEKTEEAHKSDVAVEEQLEKKPKSSEQLEKPNSSEKKDNDSTVVSE